MTLTSISFLLLLCAAALSIAELNSQLVLVNGATKNFQSETIGKLPVGNATDSGSTSESNNDVPIINNLQSRDELLNKVSSYDELHKILGKFRNFINMSFPNATGNNNGSISLTNVTTVHSSSIVIHYSWDLEKTDGAKYSILMLKFTNVLGELPTKRTDYNIMIKNGTHILFQKNGTTFTGTDMKTIDLPVAHDIQINVTRFNDKVVNEHILLPEITIQSPNQQGPVINDPNLKAELVFKGIKFPSTMAFLGPNDILLLQKDDGTVERIVNGKILSRPLLHVNVATEYERGLLGIAVSRIKSINSTQPTIYVFLYYTQSGGRKNGDDITAGIKPKCNCLYRYELVNDKLVNPKLLLSLPATPGPYHNGGKTIIGPDNNVYVVIGDLFNRRTKAQNLVNAPDADGSSGILRITQEGKPLKGILGDKFPLNLYYGYGIRNSFGIGFDPISKKLWETENGPALGDEINLVEPGFNSGWIQIQGIWTGNTNQENRGVPPNLEDFGGKGKYRAPEFTWYQPVGPTGLTFLNSTKLGKQYKNDMFVGDFNNGNIYRFKLNEQRNALIASGPLEDKVAYSTDIEPANWFDGFMNCNHIFVCVVNSTTGWHTNKTSFQISTNMTNRNTWSVISGKEIDVKPTEKYEFTTHMKLNRFATKSHVLIEGYNLNSNKWYQLSTQCPTGTNGPLDWHEYRCMITIPKDTTKIRPVLNAGWSSQPGKESVTLFDAIYLSKISPNSTCASKTCTTIDDFGKNLVSNPNFLRSVIFGRGFGHITDLQIGPDGYLYVLSLRTGTIVYPQQQFPYTAPTKETIYKIDAN